MEATEWPYISQELKKWSDYWTGQLSEARRIKDIEQKDINYRRFNYVSKRLTNRDHEQFSSGQLEDLADVLAVLVTEHPVEEFMKEFLNACDYFFSQESHSVIELKDYDKAIKWLENVEKAAGASEECFEGIVSHKVLRLMSPVLAHVSIEIEELERKREEQAEFRRGNVRESGYGDGNVMAILTLHTLLTKYLEKHAIKSGNKIILEESFRVRLEKEFFLSIKDSLDSEDFSEGDIAIPQSFAGGSEVKKTSLTIILHIVDSMGFTRLTQGAIAKILNEKSVLHKMSVRGADDIVEQFLRAEDKKLEEIFAESMYLAAKEE